MSHSSKFKPEKTPQEMAQDFLNQPLSSLAPAHEIASVLHEYDMEAHPDHYRLIKDFEEQPAPLAPNTLTVRDYMSFIAHKRFSDPFIKEETRNEAREKHGEDYEHYITDLLDYDLMGMNKVDKPLQTYLAMFEAITDLADGKTAGKHATIAPSVFRNGYQTLHITNEEMRSEADEFLDRSHSARKIEESMAWGLANKLLIDVEAGKPYDDRIPEAFKEQMPYEEVKATLDDMKKRLKGTEQYIVDRAAYAVIVAETLDDTLSIDYQKQATSSMALGKDIDREVRLNQHVLDGLKALGKDLGIKMGHREIE
jgi:hypothetical protein